MSNSLPAFSAALAHAAPVFPDRDATRDKTDAISGEARRKGARLAAFPESFLPGFPLWALVHAPIDTHGFFRRLHDHCLETHGPDIDRVAAMARRHGAYLAVGVTERSPASVGTLHNTNLLAGHLDEAAIAAVAAGDDRAERSCARRRPPSRWSPGPPASRSASRSAAPKAS